MNRRGFLQAMLGVAVAPAIVKAENIMKIWTPSQEIITDPYGLDYPEYTVSGWVKPRLDEWMHIAQVRTSLGIATYINGVKSPIVTQDVIQFQEIMKPIAKHKQVINYSGFDGWVSDLKITKTARLTNEI